MTPIPSNDAKWPEYGIEHVTCCPVCSVQERSLLHQGLEDRIFFSAPGRWNMYRCGGCGCAYLDPRPTLETIGLAYTRYYTHTTAKPNSSEDLTGLRGFRKKLANGYRNWRYGTQYQPASIFGVLAAFLIPGARHSIDIAFRFLPRTHSRSKVLDVGFGSGEFLSYARDAGWTAVGVDIDPEVIKNGRSKGFLVRHGGIEAYADEKESFDLITISHVIEHLHDPVNTLSQAYTLLKPGGILWLATPNIDSYGHARYGRHWRGLEPPRHLVVFNPKALRKLLSDLGFQQIRLISQASATRFLFAASERIKKGIDPYDERHHVPSWRAWLAVLATIGRLDKSEIINLTCMKPETP
ncbi:class I SAM-dependent methyltransferase [Methylocaldum szegediense]|jgi:2-polyprenyl-3-methyl-5-hydroxy-6-metoxy-1,4-benzoquinol methylase|uniref:class I SAM-dependent methyltransferase n=1 Tax=Methylocaldum szegediense TaxID=73780 RepID=UPI000405558E|nr:class I SAM-dependent methyltransferase [Methylocaldum szegediense]